MDLKVNFLRGRESRSASVDQDNFRKFQLEEYKNLSNSYYESVKQVSIFFRYYLLILAAPVVLLNFLYDGLNGIEQLLLGNSSPFTYNLILFYFSIVSFIGLFIFYYVVNLRHDAILYARSVNKVRRYFYENSDLKITEYEQYLPLPILSNRPRYNQSIFFIPLILVFTTINASLLFTGLYLKSLCFEFIGYGMLPFDIPLNHSTIWFATVVYMVLHYGGYYALSKIRQNRHLRYYRVGIDIDGVLNNQTEHFIYFAKTYLGKDVNKNNIKEIPVSLNNKIDITSDDERTIFSSIEYWEGLEAKDSINKRINEIQKRFGYQITLFTYRDWPQITPDIKKLIKEKGLTPLPTDKIKKITKDWLKKQGLNVVDPNSIRGRLRLLFSNSHKRLIMETGNPYISDTRFGNNFRKSILNKNRFQDTSRKGYRFFIEDTPENAIKLSSLCDYVFMFDEPYNKEENYLFPKNVIRVKSWDEIYRYLKMLG